MDPIVIKDHRQDVGSELAKNEHQHKQPSADQGPGTSHTDTIIYRNSLVYNTTHNGKTKKN